MESNNNSLGASWKALESTTKSVNNFSKEANTRLEKSTDQYKVQSEKDKAALENNGQMIRSIILTYIMLFTLSGMLN